MAPQLSPGNSYGKVLKRWRLDGFTLSETTYSPLFQVPRHSHEQAFFYTVLEGAYTEVCGQTVLTSTRPVLIYHPAGETHSHHTHNIPTRCFNIDVSPRWLERLGEYTCGLEKAVELPGGLFTSLTARLYREFQTADTLAALTSEGLALEMLAAACRHSLPVLERTPPRWLAQAHDLIYSQFLEPLTLPQIAAAVGVHPVHLSRVFRQQYRRTVGEVIRQLRIEFACRQLSQIDQSLVEVALASGFSDQSQFSRLFKQTTGMTPGTFRRMARSR